jgi:hypothetical protein
MIAVVLLLAVVVCAVMLFAGVRQLRSPDADRRTADKTVVEQLMPFLRTLLRWAAVSLGMLSGPSVLEALSQRLP